MIFWLYYAALIAVGFAVGWVSRWIYGATNQYRMLKRLTAWQKEQQRELIK